MEYVLQYFEEFLDEYHTQANQKHTYLASKIYIEFDVEEIVEESQKILKELRKVYYSLRPKSEIDEYLGKIFKRLLAIKIMIEEIADKLESVLVEVNTPRSHYGLLENFKLIYAGVHYILNDLIEMNNEFRSNVENEKLLEYNVRKTDTDCIIDSHQIFKNYIFNNIEMDYDVVKEYNIDVKPREYYIGLALCFSVGHQSIFSNYIFDLGDEAIEYSLENYAEKYYYEYVYSKQGYLRRFYVDVGRYLKKKTLEFKEDNLKIEFIIDFLVFNNLCHDLVIGYFKREVYKKVISRDYMELYNYINDQIERLEELPYSNTIKYFNSVLIGKKTKTTLNKKLQTFFTTLTRDLILNENSDLDSTGGEVNEQMVFYGTAECLGLFYKLLFEVELIKHEGEKLKISRILSNTTLFGDKKTTARPRTIYDAFSSKMRANEEGHVDFLIKKVQGMLAILKKMK